MTIAAENTVLAHLRRIGASQHRAETDMGNLKLRVSAVGEGFGEMQLQLGALSRRMDRFDERLAKMERRLDVAGR